MGKFWVHLLLSIAAILSYGLVGAPDAAKAQSEPQPAGQTVTITEPNPIVKPTDWAYLSLKLVAAKFNCLSQTSLLPTYFITHDIEITRYKFARALFDCLSELSKIIRTTDQKTQTIKREDLEPLQKLQEEFAAELSVIQSTRSHQPTPTPRRPIQPSDPIYKQLQLAIKEYDCAPETKNSNYDLGNKELKTEEFVAILKGCLQRVNQSMLSDTRKWKLPELEPLVKLESEFYSELYD
ncbi:hypothetical protein [Microcoleus sp. bin38.metabat.b11b12b14.051]|uniref:hypothetical protein n=1 Tax=Microcoleus sp. bin38.metabat.b11b12b14.051 TaxID=2742709 RepID=UPI0025DAB1B3|nr:hypothetical protein [Microcoleus sp. bin38.metabat.b11b12b14.051]